MASKLWPTTGRERESIGSMIDLDQLNEIVRKHLGIDLLPWQEHYLAQVLEQDTDQE
jgi:hypothetical protein